MEMLGKVRRMRYRDVLFRSEIARRTGLSRTTVKKWLTASERVEPRYRRSAAPGKLTPFLDVLRQALEADARRPKRDRRTAKALYAELKAQGYAGGYTVLTDFIRHWREQAGANAPTRASVPLKFELGEAFQFDGSEERLVIGGIWRKLLVAHLKLCASRAFELVAYPSKGHEMLFDAHTRSFRALGGIPQRGIYDFVPGNKIVVLCPGPLCAVPASEVRLRRRVARRRAHNLHRDRSHFIRSWF